MKRQIEFINISETLLYLFSWNCPAHVYDNIGLESLNGLIVEKPNTKFKLGSTRSTLGFPDYAVERVEITLNLWGFQIMKSKE